MPALRARRRFCPENQIHAVLRSCAPLSDPWRRQGWHMAGRITLAWLHCRNLAFSPIWSRLRSHGGASQMASPLLINVDERFLYDGRLPWTTRSARHATCARNKEWHRRLVCDRLAWSRSWGRAGIRTRHLCASADCCWLPHCSPPQGQGNARHAVVIIPRRGCSATLHVEAVPWPSLLQINGAWLKAPARPIEVAFHGCEMADLPRTASAPQHNLNYTLPIAPHPWPMGWANPCHPWRR